MYIFVNGRFIRYFKSTLKVGENYKPFYLCFYNDKPLISPSKSELKIRLNDLEKKKGE